MALVALASNRSPGLTTLGLALCCTWPLPRQVALAELDPSGGTIATRQVVPHDPGLLALAAAGSHGLVADLVLDHLQRLPAGPVVLLGPPSPDRASAALRTTVRAGMLPVLGALPGLDVLADCGRVDSASPARPVLDEADLCLWLARPTTQDILGLDHRLQTLAPDPSRCALAVLGRGPYPPEEVARVTGLRLLGCVDDDPRAADRLADGSVVPPRARLLRSVAALADAVVRELPDPPPGCPGTTSPPGEGRAVPPPSSRPPAPAT
jgi:hypothetical protein